LEKRGNRRYWEVGRLPDSFNILLLKVFDRPKGIKKPFPMAIEQGRVKKAKVKSKKAKRTIFLLLHLPE
jgi:hypothetical protein